MNFDKNKIYTEIKNSSLGELIDDNKLIEALEHTIVFDTDQEFNYNYGHSNYDCVNAFNRNGYSYFRPNFSEHEIIHETMHSISSTFDKDGHRINNGLRSFNHEHSSSLDYLNEGLTELFTEKVDNTSSHFYGLQKNFFYSIENMMQNYYGQENILEQMYIHNRPELLETFLSHTCSKENTNKVISEPYFIDADKFSSIVAEIQKGYTKEMKNRAFKQNHPRLANIKNKIKNIFKPRKNENTLLPDSTSISDSHDNFVDSLNPNNYTNYESNRGINNFSQSYMQENQKTNDGR